MKSVAPDPFAKSRQCWAVLRRMARNLAIYVQWLSMFGLLEQRGVISRWVSREMAKIESGLRAMLIIGCPRGLPDQYRTHPETPPPDQAECKDTGVPHQQTRRPVSLFSLAEFGYASPRREGPARSIAPQPIATTSIVMSPAPAQQLARRLAQITRVMAGADDFVTRMAKRIARLGLRLRMSECSRPMSSVIVNMQQRATIASPAIRVAIIDTS